MSSKQQYEEQINEFVRMGKEESIKMGSNYIGTEHLLMALIKDHNSMASKILKNLGVGPLKLQGGIENMVKSNDVMFKSPSGRIHISEQADKVLKMTFIEASDKRSDKIESEHILLSIVRDANNVGAQILEQFNISYKAIETELEEIKKGKPTDLNESEENQTPMLDELGVDLNKLALEGKIDPVIGRIKEIERVSQILARRKKNNAVLIGEPGVGKTAIAEGLAIMINDRKCPKTLYNKRIVSLDISSLVAGTKYRGEFEERLKLLLEELKGVNNVILFIDEIHTMVGAGGNRGALDAANMFKPALAKGHIQCIGATTLNEYRESIEDDGALERRFQKVMVDEPSMEETLEILNLTKDSYEQFHKVYYEPNTIENSIKLTAKYVTERFFPDKAFDAIDEAGSRVHIANVFIPKHIIEAEDKLKEIKREKEESVKIQDYELAAELREQEKELIEEIKELKVEWETNNEEKYHPVTMDDIANVISLMSGIPVGSIKETDKEKMKKLPDELRKHIIGQDEAIKSIVKAVRRSSVGMKDPSKPIGSFMFLGPTGVGKTELVKSLSRVLFGTEKSIIRLDMSEYMSGHNVSRMIGSPPGYVGYGEGGQLTEQVRRRPYSIILLDEIEKAHPEVLNILLQVFDDGILTDGSGRVVNFKNTIIIMTSNVGSKHLENDKFIGFDFGNNKKDYEQIKSQINKQIQETFKPEFINRIDDFVFFRKLEKEDIYSIVDIQINSLLKKIDFENIEINLTKKAKDFLVDKGYNDKYGARPMKRVIQEYIFDKLAEEVLDDNLESNTSITIDLKNEDELTFKYKSFHSINN